MLETWNCNTYFGSLGNGGIEVVFCFRFFKLNYLNIGWMTRRWCTRWIISSLHKAHQIGYLNRQAGPRSRIKSAGSRLKLSFPLGVLKKRARPGPWRDQSTPTLSLTIVGPLGRTDLKLRTKEQLYKREERRTRGYKDTHTHSAARIIILFFCILANLYFSGQRSSTDLLFDQIFIICNQTVYRLIKRLWTNPLTSSVFLFTVSTELGSYNINI